MSHGKSPAEREFRTEKFRAVTEPRRLGQGRNKVYEMRCQAKEATQTPESRRVSASVSWDAGVRETLPFTLFVKCAARPTTCGTRKQNRNGVESPTLDVQRKMFES